MKCYVCKKNEAIKDGYYGYLPCENCKRKSNVRQRAHRQTEMVGEDIKEQRRAHGKDILPAHRKGVLDKGFLDRYGAKKAKEQGFTDAEIKHAKYVWNESYYKEG
jgi:hypothetical protein